METLRGADMTDDRLNTLDLLIKGGNRVRLDLLPFSCHGLT